MGLDLVELAIRIEETFSIKIPDSIAAELTTPGKVTDFILTQVEETQAPLPCLSLKAFHLLRRGFIDHLAIPRRQFHVDLALKEIVPEERRDAIWKEIGCALGAKKWPFLSRPLWLSLFSREVQSVRGLVEYLLANDPILLKGAGAAWSRAQVWEVLKRVIEDETGVKDFSQNSRFVEDMHLD